MKIALITILLFSMFQANAVESSDSSDFKACVESAMADESGYEVDESEARDFCSRAE